MDGIFYMGDENRRTRNLQNRLRAISKERREVREVFVDGIYGSETEEAVKDVQRLSGLGVTGAVDKATYDAVSRLYNETLSKSQVLGFTPRFDLYEGNALSPGDELDDIYLLQLLLRELSIKDDRFFVEASGRFDPQTEKAVRLLQKTLDMDEDGRVTSKIWNALVRLTEQNEGYL